MLKFDNVSKKYAGGHEALAQVNFELKPGEMAFLTGHSGAGKSTMLKLAAKLDTCSQGRVVVSGKDLANVSSKELPLLRQGMGLIFQTPKLLADRSVWENVALPLMLTDIQSNEIKKRVRASLELVGLLKKEKVFPRHLSSGEQQRIGIARAVVHKPSLILADEPTGNLDPSLSEEIMRLFELLNSFGVTVLVATHDLGLIAKMRYRILTLKKGQLL